MAHVYIALGLSLAVVGVGLYQLWMERQQRRMQHATSSSSHDLFSTHDNDDDGLYPPSYQHIHTNITTRIETRTQDMEMALENLPPSYDTSLHHRHPYAYTSHPSQTEASSTNHNTNHTHVERTDIHAHAYRGEEGEGKEEHQRHLACGRLFARSSHLQRLLRSLVPTSHTSYDLSTLVSTYLLTSTYPRHQQQSLLDACHIRTDVMEDHTKYTTQQIQDAIHVIQSAILVLQQQQTS